MKRLTGSIGLFAALVTAFLIARCGGSGAGSGHTYTLLKACAANSGVDCEEMYGDETVSNYTGNCASNETTVTACPTMNAIGKCSRSMATGGTYVDYYYYNAGQPNQANCTAVGGTYSSLP